MPASITDLHRYGLDLASLAPHAERVARYSFLGAGPDVAPLVALTPAERLEAIAAHRLASARQIRDAYAFESFEPRDPASPAHIDAVSTVGVLRALARSDLVETIFLDRIVGLRKRREKPKLEWYSVRARVAIQVEGQTRGLQTVEDRIVLVRALDIDDAVVRLEPEWQTYARPYVNAEGRLVRWQLEEIVDVYAVLDEIDPQGTEVWSNLYSRRMKKAFEWHGDGNDED